MTTKDKMALFKKGYCQDEFAGNNRCKSQCYFCQEFQKDPDE